MRFRLSLLRVTVLAATAVLAQASQSITVTLHDGSQIKGAFAGGGADTIKVIVAGQVLTLKTSDIDVVAFDTSSGSAKPQGLTALSQVPPAASPMPAAAVTTIPANTNVLVRLIDSADSAHDAVGKEYRASLDESIVNATGVVVVPRGADVVVALATRQQSGKLTGKTELTLVLRTLTIHGKRYDVASTDVVEASSSRTSRSGKAIGGLAAAGAVIGAIAGGGKGAAIGAGSGATLGTLGQVFTTGQRVRVPPETRLTFRLQEPLLLN